MKYNADKRWKEIKDTPDDQFRQVPAGEILSRASTWSLPESFSKIVRVFDEELCQVTEHVFTDASKAMKFIEAQINDGVEVTYYDNYNLHSTFEFVSSIDE
jgi:hypothetical protein